MIKQIVDSPTTDIPKTNILLVRDKYQPFAFFDRLTGLHNRRFFDDYYQQQIRLSQYNKTDFSLIVIDIDDFKQYNTFYGHAQGNVCLKLVAKIMAELLHRPTDLAIRYGAKKFIIALPSTCIAGARFIAREIKQQLEKQVIPHVRTPLGIMTVSAGLASIATTEDEDDIFTLASHRLSLVKNAGRNISV